MQLPHELTPFSRTLQQTMAWMKDFQNALGIDNPGKAYRAARAGLHAVRDRITPTEAAHLASHMPLPIRGLYYEGYKPDTGIGHTPSKSRHEEEFLEHVRQELARSPQMEPDLDPRQVAIATLKVLAIHAPEGEIEEVRMMFHHNLDGLWQAAGV